MSTRSRVRERALTIAALAAPIAAVAAVVSRAAERREATGDAARSASATVADWRPVAAEGARIGPANSVVTIVEFSDFGCPACRVSAPRFRELLRRHPQELALVYRHFPLDRRSREAAVAAECSRHSGAFATMHDVLFSQADSLGIKPWTALARDAGVADTAQFAACLADSTAIATVWRDTRAGDALHVERTPSFLVNDQFFEGAADVEGLDSYITALLAKRR
jgi:protein-disulfide isomerase